VHLSGGEPAARRDLVEITASAHAAGLYSNLITSAVGLTQQKLAALVAAGLDHVQISIQDSEQQSADHIAGYAVLNDVSMRDYQNRTMQWLQGKCFERTTPLGPWLVTPDESPGPSREVVCEVDGVVKQQADTSDLLFGPTELVAYISQLLTLEPGDVIATGTPGGVGFARNPPEFLVDGSVMVTRIEGLGACRNACRAAD